jgi:hypothetical protein
MTCIPNVNGVVSTVRGEGGCGYASVTFVADAVGGADSPMTTAAINDITAQPRDRITRNT